MIDPADKQTHPLPLDEQPEKRKRGRPATGRAMTPAEKQRAYRERQKELKAYWSNASKEQRYTKAYPKTPDDAVPVMLTRQERLAISSVLQDKALAMSARRLAGGPVQEDDLQSAGWLNTLANRIGMA